MKRSGPAVWRIPACLTQPFSPTKMFDFAAHIHLYARSEVPASQGESLESPVKLVC